VADDQNRTGEILEVAPLSTSNVITSSPHTQVMQSARGAHHNSAIRRPIIVPKIMIRDEAAVSTTQPKKENSNKVDEEIRQVELELKSELIKICGMLS